ncbi:MAG TPA: HAMP domain-containing sensor histidine kinase [Acidobacteriaceae bacterium]|nr:HAMP domain-containing sensor histidine kinase [Acidobacteriaceae bacterium]
MELVEAERPSVREIPNGAKRLAEICPTPGVTMTGSSIPAVLMLRCAAVSHHSVRAAARHAGLRLTLEFVENRREFLEELHRGSTDLIIAGTEGLTDLDVREVIDRARSADIPIPVLLAGGRTGEAGAVRMLRDGATEIVQSGELERLPSAIARALKVRQSAIVQSHAQHELDRSAVMPRENQKLITIGRLAASIAHEINNPLESVMNLLFLLGEEKSLSPTVTSYLALAQRELDRVAQISRQTLKFSRETSGPVPVHIEELLEEVLSLYGRRMMEKNLRVERQYDCGEEAIVYPGEMRQVLSNLVTNAIEASSLRGRLRLRVRSTRSWSDPQVRGIRVSVADTGSGIPPEVQRRLGEPFFTTKGQRGTGLGLWVTRSIIQRYGGEMQLRSSVHPDRHGTVFTIFLPTNLRPRAVDRPPHGAGENGGSGSVTPFPAPGSSGAAADISRGGESARRSRGA